MKRILIMLFATLAFVIPASAQWVRTEKKNLITGKTETTFALKSQEPEKALLLLMCDGSVNPVESGGDPLQLNPGFAGKSIWWQL
jgi:hypothetical protein